MKNFKLLIIIFNFALLIFNFGIPDANAALIIQAPKYIGLTNGLVGYWSFDGKDMAGGTAPHPPGHPHNRAPPQRPTRAIGKIGQGLSFDGVDDVIDAGTNITPKANGISGSAWVNMLGVADIANDDRVVMSLWTTGSTGNFNFGVGDYGLANDNRLSFTANPDDTWPNVLSTGTINLNGWQHIAFTYDGNPVGAGNEYLRVCSNGVSHPGGTLGDAAVTWQAPSTQSVYYKAVLSDGDGGGGDGIVFKILNNSTELSSNTYANGFTEQTLTGSVSMTAGDQLHFRINKNANNDYDGTNLAIYVYPGGVADDYVNMGDVNALDGISQMTISAWAKPSALYPFVNVVSKSETGGGGIVILTDGSIDGCSGDSRNVIVAVAGECGYTTSNFLQAGTWGLWTMVYDGTQTGDSSRMKFYFNGVEQSLSFFGSVPATTASNAYNLRIGADSANN